MDKSVDVDFDWVRNVVAEGKTREYGVSTEREDTFLLLDVRRSTDSVIATFEVRHQTTAQSIGLLKTAGICCEMGHELSLRNQDKVFQSKA